MALPSTLGTIAGIAAALTVPQRLFPFPDGKRLQSPGVAPGLRGGPARGLFGGDGCAEGLAVVHTEGVLRGITCVTPEDAEQFHREREQRRLYQILTGVGFVLGGYAVGRLLENGR